MLDNVSLELVSKLFIVAFFLNILWELWHSQLYETCENMKLSPYIRLITLMSAKDAFFILLFYGISITVFQNFYILENPYQLFAFGFSAFIFSYVDERVSLKRERWKYNKRMPIVFGVGITPLLEVAVTGIAALLIIF